MGILEQSKIVYPIKLPNKDFTLKQLIDEIFENSHHKEEIKKQLKENNII